MQETNLYFLSNPNISCISSSKKFSNCVKHSIKLLRSVPSKYELVISFLFTISKSSLNFLQYLSGLFIFISLPLCLYYTIFFTNSQVILLAFYRIIEFFSKIPTTKLYFFTYFFISKSSKFSSR